ncbi:MAG: hypothetical protein KC983_04450 [Phycisphaerales bacterium]|nr:hypothetical protein [Phycisphaerales bacterium]
MAFPDWLDECLIVQRDKSMANMRLVVGAALGCVLTLGCTHQTPTIGISDPAVFTTLHIAAAQRAFEDDLKADGVLAGGRMAVLSPFADLQRYFASPAKDFDAKRLRMDEMLDQRQRSESLAYATAFLLNIRAKYGDGISLPETNSGTGEDDGPQANAGIAAEDLAFLRKAFDVNPQDSPFDRFERARAFYTTYVLAILRLYGIDSRAVDVRTIDPIGVFSAEHPTVTHPPSSEEVKNAIANAERLGRFASEKLEDPRFSDRLAFVDSNSPGTAGSPTNANVMILTQSITTPGQELDEDAVKEHAKSIKTLQAKLKDKRKLENEASQKSGSATKSVDAAKAALDKAAAQTKAAKAAVELAENRFRAAKDDVTRKFELAKVDEAKTALASAVSAEAKAKGNADAGKKAADEARKLAEGAAKETTSARAALSRTESELHDLIWNRARILAAQSPLPDGQEPKRLVLIMFQVHVEPGNIADQVAGLELGAEDDCSIIFVHPGRTYDLNEGSSLDVASETIAAALAGSFGQFGEAAVDVESRKQQEARRRYLSRINRMASFADASGTTSSFGWYFYPSNVQLEAAAFGGWNAKGYIEAGARDCAVWMLVDRKRKALKLTIKTRTGSIKDDVYSTDKVRVVDVNLPPYTPAEHGHVNADGAAPVFSPN